MIKAVLNRHKIVLTLFLIICFSLLLRFYKLGAIPLSLDWDEASLGWNSYSFLKTGSDEYGNPHPVSIRSFNDYKPPVYVYASIPIVGVLGLNEFSIRTLSAISGIGTVLLIFPLTLLLTNRRRVALLAALICSFVPWAVQFSRVSFEANVALFFAVAGVTALLWYLKSPKAIRLMVAATALVLAIYSYHSARLFIPVFALAIGLIYWKSFWNSRKNVVVAIILAVLLLLPLLRSTLRVGSLQARFSAVSIFDQSYLDSVKKTSNTSWPIFTYATIIAKNNLDHFNFDFLFLTGDENERHHAPGVGMFLLVQLPIILAGFYFLIKKGVVWKRLIIAWLVIGPLASALTATTPHAVRALASLPPWIIISAYGLDQLAQSIKRKRLLTVSLFAVLLVFNLYYYLNRYFVHMPIEYAKTWQYGYKELVHYVLSGEDKYDQVYVTSYYDQPYIYFLFYGRISPVVKNNTFFYKSMDKYTFGDFCLADRQSLLKDNRLLIVLAPRENNCIEREIKHTINFPDGTPAFLISDNL